MLTRATERHPGDKKVEVDSYPCPRRENMLVPPPIVFTIEARLSNKEPAAVEDRCYTGPHTRIISTTGFFTVEKLVCHVYSAEALWVGIGSHTEQE